MPNNSRVFPSNSLSIPFHSFALEGEGIQGEGKPFHSLVNPIPLPCFPSAFLSLNLNFIPIVLSGMEPASLRHSIPQLPQLLVCSGFFRTPARHPPGSALGKPLVNRSCLGYQGKLPSYLEQPVTAFLLPSSLTLVVNHNSLIQGLICFIPQLALSLDSSTAKAMLKTLTNG